MNSDKLNMTGAGITPAKIINGVSFIESSEIEHPTKIISVKDMIVAIRPEYIDDPDFIQVGIISIKKALTAARAGVIA